MRRFLAACLLRYKSMMSLRSPTMLGPRKQGLHIIVIHFKRAEMLLYLPLDITSLVTTFWNIFSNSNLNLKLSKNQIVLEIVPYIVSTVETVLWEISQRISSQFMNVPWSILAARNRGEVMRRKGRDPEQRFFWGPKPWGENEEIFSSNGTGMTFFKTFCLVCKNFTCYSNLF